MKYFIYHRYITVYNVDITHAYTYNPITGGVQPYTCNCERIGNDVSITYECIPI